MKKIAALFLLLALFVGCCPAPSQKVVVDERQADPAKFWQDGYALQTTAKTPAAGADSISALVDGKWQNFELVEFPQDFIDWNKARRIETIEVIKAMMSGGGMGKGPELAGPHNGIVATEGFRREDASFSLNNAVKGMGFLPREDKIKGIIELVESTMDAPMPEKLQTLVSFYEGVDTIFAMDRQVSLELYATPDFMTQSFMNQMENPISTIVFLDMPSYKLKTIVRLLDPNDPNLTDYEKDAVKYINLIHSYFHGNFSKDFIAAVYYVNQVYDNSPMGGNPETGMGRRVVPAFP